MGLDAIKNKSEAKGLKASSLLRINMYENPQMALDLIAHICNASTNKEVNVSLGACSSEYEDLVSQMESRLPNLQFVNKDFIKNCYSIGSQLCSQLNYYVSSNLRIAVAGGYSTGKSSLLNTITGIGDMLPTGIDPISMVNTFLNCSSSHKSLRIRGENYRNDMVGLDADVLACVQHSSSSKVYVSSVLQKIILDVPTTKELDGITFIDTPGYDNSDSVTDGSRERDADKALRAVLDADVLFWCISADTGTIPASDIHFLNTVADRIGKIPIVIFFTMMILKDESEMNAILQSAAQLSNNSIQGKIIDICGIQCDGRTMEFKSYKGYHSVYDIILNLKRIFGDTNYLKRAKTKLDSLFADEIRASEEAILSYEKSRKKSVDNKSNLQSSSYKKKKEYDALEYELKDQLLDSYDEIISLQNNRQSFFEDIWFKSLDAINDILKEVSDIPNLFKSKKEKINTEATVAKRRINIIHDNYPTCDYYPRKDREETFNKVQNAMKEGSDLRKEIREREEKLYKIQVQSKQNNKDLIDILRDYQPRLHSSLKKCFESCIKLVSDRNAKLQAVKEEQDSDIFSAIYSDNWKRFLVCCSHGVDMSICNEKGYSPLTLACKQGNNEMVKFLLDNGANPSEKDNRHLNALETAVLYHYRDICEILLERNSSLMSTSDSLLDIAKQNSFIEWLKQL